MGEGISCRCKKCGYTFSANLGVGFMFPKVYSETVSEMKKGTFGEIGKQFFEEYPHGVRRHIVGGTNRTLISVILPPRLHSPVGDRRLLAGQPHAVVALFQRQDSCF